MFRVFRVKRRMKRDESFRDDRPGTRGDLNIGWVFPPYNDARPRVQTSDLPEGGDDCHFLYSRTWSTLGPLGLAGGHELYIYSRFVHVVGYNCSYTSAPLG